MRKLFIIFIIFFNLLFANKVVTLATDSFPPFHSPEVKGYGFFAEIVSSAFKEKGYEQKLSLFLGIEPWKMVQPAIMMEL